LGLIGKRTFMAGCLARTPFREQIAGAAAAGFEAITIWPNIWRHAMAKDRLSIAEMRAMLDDHGLVLTDVDAYRDWGPPRTSESGVFGPMKRGFPLDECLDVLAALGGRTLVAVHLTDTPFNWDRDVAEFVQICDKAAERGLRVGIEFVPFSNIPDVATAWSIVEKSGRPNAGLIVDLWHHIRGGGDDAALARVAPDRIYTVQFSDGPAKPPNDLAQEAMFHRCWPGEGDFNLTGLLRLLNAMGASAALGPELYQPSFADRNPAHVIQALAACADRTYSAAGIS
jgi:sugar phosphate isomerase/epimerase